jgi:hypothetical protein
MHIPLIIFGIFSLVGIGALVFYIQRLSRTEARRWKSDK